MSHTKQKKMILEYEILFNKYGQGIILPEVLVSNFLEANKDEQKSFLTIYYFLLANQNLNIRILKKFIESSSLRPTYTPCVL